MINDAIHSMLELHESAWSKSMAKLIISSETHLLSEKPGTYTASSLLAELRIRSKTVRDAGIESIGMTEMLTSLHEIDGNTPVQNYVFKNLSQTGIVYLNGDTKTIIGAILIGSSQSPQQKVSLN